MHYKILLTMQNIPEAEGILLGGVSELDETFVLDSYKGKQLPEDVERKPRKHGAKVEKCGISNEYVCICTGIERDGTAYAATVNRAKPDADELAQPFENHIAKGSLVLCDGLKSYNILPTIAECTVKSCNMPTEEEKRFYHLNTVNRFHSFIKQRYDFYRGVATKYLNRFNILFAASYRNINTLINQLKRVLLSVGTADYCHSNREVRTARLLAI